jgi:hypothetical protein
VTLADRGGEHRHLAPEGREVRHTPASRTVERHQLRDGPSPLHDHNLAPLSHLVEEKREVLAGFANAGSPHDAMALHVAHGVNREAMGRSGCYAALISTRLRAPAICPWAGSVNI